MIIIDLQIFVIILQNGISPLLAAVQHQGLLETVKLLLTKGVDLEVTNDVS